MDTTGEHPKVGEETTGWRIYKGSADFMADLHDWVGKAIPMLVVTSLKD